MPDRSRGRQVDKYILPAAIRRDETVPLSALNHLTVPVSSTATSVDGPFDVSARMRDRPDALGAAVLISSTSVTCGP
jgi:hypothetical protein